MNLKQGQLQGFRKELWELVLVRFEREWMEVVYRSELPLCLSECGFCKHFKVKATVDMEQQSRLFTLATHI